MDIKIKSQKKFSPPHPQYVYKLMPLFKKIIVFQTSSFFVDITDLNLELFQKYAHQNINYSNYKCTKSISNTKNSINEVT